MKKFLVLIILFSVPFILRAQQDRRMMNKRMGRLVELEQLKLINLLNLDETTAVKLFARRKRNLNEQQALIEKKKEYIKELKKAVKENDDEKCDSLINKILNIEKESVKKRDEFIRSLSDILTKEQIAKVIIFETRFKDELKNYFMHHRMRR
jgi:hypothetical protein